MTAPADKDAIRVLVADDHPLYLEGLRAVLDVQPGIEVVGQATNGATAVDLAGALLPDVVVMDVRMPELNGIEATRLIVAATPLVGVLVLTMDGDDESVFAAMRAGARGYLLKEAGPVQITLAIRALAHGEAVFGPDIAMRVMEFFNRPRATLPAPAFPQLTDREREILELVAQGRNNDRIAATLYVSGKTVRNHVSNIFTKLQVADRAQAIVRAREAGMGTND
ncbi:MAG: response regulator transcription factor [Actinomycetota bacterium]|nr:response regulator transcription factor [Actinomycetota bacterium]